VNSFSVIGEYLTDVILKVPVIAGDDPV